MKRLLNIVLGLTVGGMVVPITSIIACTIVIMQSSNLKAWTRSNTNSLAIIILYYNLVGVLSNFRAEAVDIGLIACSFAAFVYALRVKSKTLTVLTGLVMASMAFTIYDPNIIRNPLYIEFAMQCFVAVGVCFVFIKFNHPFQRAKYKNNEGQLK
jgi:hypothetical protein